MKKILSLLLVLVIGVTLFTACSNKESAKNTEIKTEVEIEDVVTDANQNTTNIEKEKKDALENAIKNKEPEPTRTGRYSHVKGDIKEQKIYDDNGIVIVAKGFDLNDFRPRFVLEIENNAEHDFEFTVENVAINKYTMETEMEKVIYPGTKEEVGFEFANLTFFEQRITTIEEIAFTINMTDNETKLTTGEIVLKTGLKAEKYPEIANGQTVIDNNGVKITYLDMELPNKYHYGPVLYFYIENNTDYEIGINSKDREVKVNDKTVDASFSPHIYPGKRMISRLEIDNKDLTAFKISTIETVSVDDWKCINDDSHTVLFENETFKIENLQNTVIEIDRKEID